MRAARRPPDSLERGPRTRRGPRPAPGGSFPGPAPALTLPDRPQACRAVGIASISRELTARASKRFRENRSPPALVLWTREGGRDGQTDRLGGGGDARRRLGGGAGRDAGRRQRGRRVRAAGDRRAWVPCSNHELLL